MQASCQDSRDVLSAAAADWTAAGPRGDPGAVTVDAPDAPLAPNGTDDGDSQPGTPPSRTGRRGRVVIGCVVVVLLAMWAYVLFLAFGPGRQPPIDRLDDPAFAQSGEDRCAEALSAIGELPVASATPDPADRADVLDEANAIYAAMIDDLDEMTRLVPDAEQRGHAREWVADWRTHLGDRQAYATALRTDPGARLLVSEKAGEGRQITGWIDEFALANRMPSCVSPTDA
jgi:hypothetical protein